MTRTVPGCSRCQGWGRSCCRPCPRPSPTIPLWSHLLLVSWCLGVNWPPSGRKTLIKSFWVSGELISSLASCICVVGCGLLPERCSCTLFTGPAVCCVVYGVWDKQWKNRRSCLPYGVLEINVWFPRDLPWANLHTILKAFPLLVRLHALKTGENVSRRSFLNIFWVSRRVVCTL